MNNKPKLLYFCITRATFVKKDIAILEEEYDVKICEFYHSNKKYTPLLFAKQLWFILANAIGCKLIICQFAGYHSFLPTFVGQWIGIPTLIIAGGTDCVSFPSLRYGNFHKQLLGLFTRKSYELCTHLSPVHESLLKRHDTYYGDDSYKQGILHYCPEIDPEIRTIYNGYDIAAWPQSTEVRKPNSFITVAMDLDNPVRMSLKGADMVLDVAALMPDYTFTIVGYRGKHKAKWPANVIVLPPQSHQDLVQLFGQHEFYMQLSISEGFPNALCEAMLCGCIPIVSEVASMSFIVGDTGFVLTQRNVRLLKELLLEATNSEKKSLLTKAARARVSQNFALQKRRQALLALSHDMLRYKKTELYK